MTPIVSLCGKENTKDETPSQIWENKQVCFLCAWLFTMILMACQPNNSDITSAVGEASTVAPPSSLEPTLGNLPTFHIQTSDGNQTITENQEEAEAVVPFKIISPAPLPEDMRLKKAFISQPRESLSTTARRRQTRVQLVFRNAGDTAGFILTESILEDGMSPITIDGPGVKSELPVAGVDGQMIVNEEGKSMILGWHGCGVNFSLAATTQEITIDEAVQVANSTASCEDL